MITEASFIGIPIDMGTVCPMFSKTFKTKKNISNATLSVSAVGVYEAFINGRRVGNFILAPGCTAYQKRLQYQTYDVTSLLQDDNCLNITVGTGWYRGSISSNSKTIHSLPCALIAELVITYEDGSFDTILSDESFLVSKSKFLFSDLYDGEIYDATADDSQCVNACIIPNNALKDTLLFQEGEIVCEHERIRPVRYFITPKGEHVIDFGQNLAGYIEFTVNAQKGDRIVISHAEILDKDGNFYTENYRTAKARIDYTCSDGLQTYKPHFTFFGFRYIRLDQFPGEICPDDFTAIAVYSDIKRTGYIESSDKRLNQLVSNTLWSQRSNFLDIPTDCPQRNERMGWLGDAQVFASTAAYNYDVKRFFTKWLNDVCTEQFTNGAIPDIVPNFWQHNGSSSAWGDAITIIPWQIYTIYGDTTILANNFESMKKWVDYITNDTIDKYLWTSPDSEKRLWGKHYGDWLALDAPQGSYMGSTDQDFIASAFYAYSTLLLAKAGKVLGKDVQEYETLYRNIVATFKLRFPTYKTQTEHVLALYFNLTENKKETAKSLADMIITNGYKLTTGFVGTPYLLYALSENGYTDIAYKLLFQEEYPSWFYEVNHGATTIWEHWDGIRDDGTFWSSDMNSYNHYAYGSVIGWVYQIAAGIKADERYPGFNKKVIIAPHPGKELGWLNAYLDTANGRISSKWTYLSDRIRYEIECPVQAVVIIDEKEYLMEPGSYIFYGKLK